MLSSGLAGIAGGLFAHVLGYINPGTFTIMKSTEVLVMVYLGGMGSLSGSVLSAIGLTIVLELFRPLQVAKWVVVPLLLILLMLFRPEGIMGHRELTDIFPRLAPLFLITGEARPRWHFLKSKISLISSADFEPSTTSTLASKGGELLGLIGPNGAGKTTVFNLVSGFYRPTEGEILFQGKNIIGLRPHQVTGLGMARTFQNIRLWNSLTVFDNLCVSQHYHLGYGFSQPMLRNRQVSGKRAPGEEDRRGDTRHSGNQPLRPRISQKPALRPSAAGRDRPRPLLSSPSSCSSTNPRPA